MCRSTARSFAMPGRALPAVVLMALLTSGCVVGPDYQQPQTALPLRWSGANKAHISRPPELSQWWKKLNDQTLNALIEEAVAGNLDVAASKARIREARASYRQNIGALFPSADGSASATRNRSAASTSGVTETYSQFRAGFDASWEIDLFGGKRRAVEAARYGMDAAEEDLRATLLTMIGDVASNYVEARGYQARVALARRTATSQNETVKLTRTRLEAGDASAVGVANASGLASNTEANIPTLEASYAQAVHRLSVLTGRPPAALADRLKKTAPIPSPKLPIPTGIPADILLTRPDVRLAERQYAQYTARIGQAEADRYPAVSLTGDIATTGLKLGDLGKSSTISWSFGPTLTVPIFNAGQLAAAADIARAQRDQHFIAWRASVLTALEDVENAIVALAQERVRNGKLATSARHYRDGASFARTLYQSGSTSFLELLEAERSLYSAEDALIQSRVSIATDYIALNKALGGGWDGLVDASKPEIVDVNAGPHFKKPDGPSNVVAANN
ncbi:MAG: efflux transporter outer membrane subunit [Mesorhizobium sp.]|uniref:efflux transporter outer membrane subunit n=1 Tax=Mesorhizobium sp. TaxID=1871066 RepID=UPI000FE4907F|nr:efflux transporter outer membrane subunit [Mesorhizobium sp.]RWI57073.1 MAG: efflux transporter outer membrane subunit [Mesorhizobium sp.]